MGGEFIEVVKTMGTFLLIYITLYAPIRGILVTYVQPVVDAWLFNIWSFIWDHLYLGIAAGALMKGVLRGQMREPRSAIQEVQYE